MEGFQVGNKLVATPGLSQEDIVKIEEQKAKEDLMLQGVTEETLQIALTPEQEAAVSQVCSAIDLSDGKMITTYGLEDAKTLDKLTEKSLSNVRSKDAGDTGALLLKLTNEIAVGQDTDTTGFFGFIRSMGDKAKALQIRYESVQDNINRVKAVLERNIVVLNETSLNMEDMIKANKENYQRLTVYVTAGKQKLNEAYEKDIPELEALASKGGQEEAEKLNALKQATNLFALQVADLEAQMALSMSLAIQLTNMNYANYALIQRTNRTINNMIPAWRISMAAAIAGQTTLDAYEVDKKVNDGINDAIRKASDKARETVGAVVRHAESTGLTAETIEYAQVMSSKHSMRLTRHKLLDENAVKKPVFVLAKPKNKFVRNY